MPAPAPTMILLAAFVELRRDRASVRLVGRGILVKGDGVGIDWLTVV